MLESFSPIGATRFYWVLFTFALASSLAFLIGLYKAITSKAEVIFTHKMIIVPAAILSFSKTKTVPFNEILSLEIHTVNRARTLKIIHKTGSVNIQEAMLPKKAAFDEICDRLNNQREVDPTS